MYMAETIQLDTVLAVKRPLVASVRIIPNTRHGYANPAIQSYFSYVYLKSLYFLNSSFLRRKKVENRIYEN